METLMAVKKAAREANPNVILISEPWSFRGDHKYALKGTGWSAWNNQFTHPVRAFILVRPPFLSEAEQDAIVEAVKSVLK